jgi:hypothetical protein
MSISGENKRRKVMQRQKQRAMVFILVVMVLVSLTTLAVTFVSLARLESRAVGNFSHYLDARLASQAGLEYALARLHECFRKDEWYGNPAYRDAKGNLVLDKSVMATLWHYGGEDINCDGVRQLENGEADVDRDNTLHCPLDMGSRTEGSLLLDGITLYIVPWT